MYDRKEPGTPPKFPIKHVLEAIDINKPEKTRDVDSILYWKDTAEGDEVWRDIDHGIGYEKFDAYWKQQGGLNL